MKILLKKCTVRILSVTALISTAFMAYKAPVAQASNLVFVGQNAGLFPNANPNDTSILMNSVSRKNATASSQSITQQNMTQLVQNAVIAQLSNNIYADIAKYKSTNPRTVDLGNYNSITYVYDSINNNVNITLTNPATGTTTITVPAGIL